MAVKFELLIICLMTLMPRSKELPIEGSTLPPEPIPNGHHHGIHTPNGKKSMHHYEDENLNVTRTELDHSGNRYNYSRLLTLTSNGYDDWWYLTTRRPHLSLKDFPGRPGVASWKEISPFSSDENKKSHDVDSPTAAGVASDSSSFMCNSHYIQNLMSYFFTLFWIYCFCWI